MTQPSNHAAGAAALQAQAFGARLRALRAELGVSQDELARRTDIHPTAIGRLERGARQPGLQTILRLAHGLNIKPGRLVDDLAPDAERYFSDL